MARILDSSSQPVFDDVSSSGTPVALGDTVTLTLTGQSGAAFMITDVGVSVLTLTFEGSVDGTNFAVLPGVRQSDGTVASTTSANGLWCFTTAGLSRIRMRVSAYTSGSCKIAAKGGQGTGNFAYGGAVSVVGPVAVTGPLTDAQLRASAVPVSLSSDIEIGAVELKNGTDDTRATVTASNALKVDGSAVTQPISAASLPLPTGAATLAAQTQPGVDIGDVTVNNAAGAAAVNIQDGGNSITIDGTVTATSAGQAADGAAVVGNPVRIGGKDGGGLTQDIITDATGVLAIQDNGGSLTVDSTQLPAVLAAGGGLKVEGVAGGVAQPISAASLPLPTGASTLAGQTQPGVDIGDVTINNAAGASAVNIQDGGNSITVDGSISITGAVDTELPAAVALADTVANPTVPAVGAFNMVWNGATWDRMMGNAAAGVEVQGAAATGVAKSGNPVQIGAVFNTTQPTVTTGQVVEAQATARGARIVATGVDAFTVDTELPVAAALADATANPTTPLAGAANEVFNGATWDRMRGTTLGAFVQGPAADGGIVTSNPVRIGGKGVSGATQDILTDDAGILLAVVQGSTAHDVPVAGNPVLVAAEARTTNPTAVANADTARLISDKLGRLVVVPGHVRDLITQNTITLTTTTETTLIAAVAAVFNDVVSLIMTNTSATGVRIDFRDATGGTVRFSVFLAASGGGAVINPTRAYKQTTVNNNWTAQLSAAVTDVRIFAQVEQNT